MKLNYKEAKEFLQSLIQINSVNPPGNELAVARKIVEQADSVGLETEIKMLEKDRANVLVRLKGKDPDRPTLIYSGHLDTVPVGELSWEIDPFSGKEMDGKIYGLGTSDMKGGVAAMIEAMMALKRSGVVLEGDVIFAGTVGEEVDCLGALAFIDEKLFAGAGAVVISEPSNGEVFIAHKGALWIEIETYGKTAHGSMPDQGTNAVLHMNEIINRLKKYEFTCQKHQLLSEPTLNIGTIYGGVKTNVVPDRCTVTLDIRTVPGVDHQKVLRDITNIIQDLEARKENFRGKVHVLNERQPLSTSEDHPFVKLALETNEELSGSKCSAKGANYYTDGSVFGPMTGLPVIIYGPGDEKMAHQPNEYVEIEKYNKSIHYYANIARKYFSLNQRELTSFNGVFI